MNPDNHGVESGPKLSMQIAKEEEYLGLNRSTAERNNVVNVVEEDGLQDGGEKEKTEKPSKVKFLGFQLDTTYPRTVPGFVRIVQVVSYLLSTVCVTDHSSNWSPGLKRNSLSADAWWSNAVLMWSVWRFAAHLNQTSWRWWFSAAQKRLQNTLKKGPQVVWLYCKYMRLCFQLLSLSTTKT